LKDALHFWFKNDIRRVDGGELKEIRRVGRWQTEFLDICKPIPLLKILKEIEDNRITPANVADSKNAIIEDVEDGYEDIIEEIEAFQDQYKIEGSFLTTLKQIANENIVYMMLFD
jgi:hypothetical protein